ncbi:MAG: UDP-N-acetylglucosamine 1-carboxyvinyltransferase, partial [Candidatus Margulisiibacteriota bacterium]
MGKLIVNGHIPLHGQVSASGAKNAALPILAGVILAEGETELTNVPRLADIVTMTSMLNALGLRAELHAGNRMKIWNTRKVRHLAPYDLVTSMRASFFVAGPILARTGFAKVPLPGGCAIGTRPVDIHLKGFQALGAAISIEHGFVELKAKKLVGTRIRLDFPSVGATENIMMAGTLAEGTTIINNAAQEPEIVDLGNFLISAGATIEGLGTPEITIH